MTNERLCVHGFQLAQLVWPPVELGDASWLMAWSEQVTHREFNALFGREETLDEFLVTSERVGSLVVDPRDVVELKLDAGNCGPAYNDLNESAQRTCCREPFRDGCACSDAVRVLPHCGAPRNGQRRARAADQQRWLHQQLKTANERLSFVACVPELREIRQGSFELEPPARARSDRLCLG